MIILLRFTDLFKKNFFRKSVFLLTILVILTNVNAQTNEWTWVSGDNTTNNSPVYGTQGIPDAANKPGNRDYHSKWIDAAGNLWIFGGKDFNRGSYNDLWKYTIATGQWTWVSGDNSINNRGVYGTKGGAAAGNKPGARYGQASWSDAAGNFWLFGGFGIDGAGISTVLNDLWKFNPATGLWTWIGGDAINQNVLGVYGTKGIAAATNIPGPRTNATGWADASGNCWIFGGLGFNHASSIAGELNDLWVFNTVTNQWTWVSGDDALNVTGVYGTRGIPDAANKPGGRRLNSGWVDGSGNFWIFGGESVSSSTNYYNDLWRYEPGTGQWTWVSGDNTPHNDGVYGTKGVGATTNKPGARRGVSEMTDANGNFWFFGGHGHGASGATGRLNDLWAYTPSTGTWTWVSGDQTRGSTGEYGTKGVGAATNKPGGREGQTGWIDGAGNLWIFGGFTIPSLSQTDFNDLWKFSILNALPVRDLSLNGIHNSHNNLLLWQTTDESNTAWFNIERSSNGADFKVIGKVAAAGTGNNRYSFTDANPNGASCFYRIKTEDVDGFASYSRTIFLKGVTDNSSISVYPNPAGANLVLQTTDNSLLNTRVKLYDAGGRLVKELRITSPQQPIDLHDLSRGVLWLQLSNGKVFTVVKE